MEETFAKLRAMHRKASAALVCLLVLLPLTILLFIAAGPLGLIGIPCLIVLFVLTSRWTKQYTSCFKEEIVRGVLEEVFTDLTFLPAQGIPAETVASTGMIQMGNRYASNDLITGRYRGVGFTQSDVTIEDESTDSDGDTTTTTLFCGRWIMLEFNKEFGCELQVISRGFGSARRKNGIFTRKSDRRTRIELENEAFNKEFSVYGQDEHEAFYLLTPAILDALLRLRQGLNAPLMLMFTGGILHVAVYTNRDAFEVRLLGKTDPAVMRDRVMDDIRVITGFIDEMSLDRAIFRSYRTSPTDI